MSKANQDLYGRKSSHQPYRQQHKDVYSSQITQRKRLDMGLGLGSNMHTNETMKN